MNVTPAASPSAPEESPVEPTPPAPAPQPPPRRGARGAQVEALQRQLTRAGHGLERYGVDGHFGAETAGALREFQRLQGLPATGVVDLATLAALEARAELPRAPEYEALFADGVLQVALAIGYDELGFHEAEVHKTVAGLFARGYRPASLSERERFGLEAATLAWVRPPPPDGDAVTVVLELITPETPDAKARFARAMARTELVLYGGHARYGSGPDFDHISSPAGNYVIGAPTKPGVVALGPNDLPTTDFTPEYQLVFFDGCSTHHYFDELRALPAGKTTKNLDLLGSTTELFWDVTATNLFAVLDGVTEGQDVEQLTTTLDAFNREGPEDRRQYFTANGFQDNP